MTKETIARATSSVSQGKSSTSSLIYEQGKSRSDLVPGNTYSINAEYQQNNHYENAEGIGELIMLKCSTTTTISGEKSITLGNNIILTITVTENKNNTMLSQGTVTIYDGNDIIQNNYKLTGLYTMITFTPTRVGTHDIYAIFTDSGVEYNSSTSNHMAVEVRKKESYFTSDYNTIDMYVGDTITINGKLQSDISTPLSEQNVSLVDYDGVTIATTITSSNGSFSFDYTPINWNVHLQNISLVYNGNNEQDTAKKDIQVTLHKHDVNLTLPQNIVKYTDDYTSITATALDENNNNVTSGTLEWSITKTFFNPNKFYKGVVNNNDTFVVSDTSGNTYEWELDEGEYNETDELFVVILEDNVQSLEISESNVTITNPKTLYVAPEEVEDLYGYIIDNSNDYYDTIHDSFYSQENIMLWNGSTQTQYIVEPVFEIHNIILHYTASQMQGQENLFTLESEEYTGEELAGLLGDHVADIQYEEGNTGTVQSIAYSSYYERAMAVTNINSTQSHEWIIQIGTAIYKMTYTLP